MLHARRFEFSGFDGGDDLELSENAVAVLEKRYLIKDKSGKTIETPDGMFRRVAENIASAELKHGKSKADVKRIEREFYDFIKSLEFMPNSPTLMNAGRDMQQLSACFVLPIEDSMESIFTSLKDAAMIHKSGGGTGFAFSRIRPKADPVLSTMGVSSGPISFMKVYNAATEAIKQGGTRRGANMGILRVDHPDIMDFIKCKEDPTKLTNFNISVALTEDFMKAVVDDEEYELLNPRTKDCAGKLKAREVFDTISEMAWRNGEPGIVFLDRINRDNPTPAIGEIESTNPCGEQPLLPYESCNLGSINLALMVKGGDVNWDRLRTVTRTAVRFLDNVIDVNNYPLPEISKMSLGNRKIGLGVMGWADMLVQLGIAYDSPKALKLAEKLMKFVQDEGWKMSEELAEEKGAFPNYPKSKFAKGKKVRNATVTTIAPTGTISMIVDCSSGVEPNFSVAYLKRVMDGRELPYANRYFEELVKRRGIRTDELMEKVAKAGHIQEIEEIPEDIRKLFLTAHDISPEGHIMMQAAFQKYTDNAVSKTVNMSNDAKVADVASVFKLAYETGCKGVTVYRDGSREFQVLSSGTQKDQAKAVQTRLSLGEIDVDENGKLKPRARPLVTTGSTVRMTTGCGYLYVTINEDERGLFEIFARMGKTGGCAASQTEAIGRLISLSLRSGIDPVAVVKQLKGIRCPVPAPLAKERCLSCPDAVGQAFEIFMKNKGEKMVFDVKPSDRGLRPECPECGAPIEFAEGCAVCPACGYSKC
jgi:ribonucleoside-diphosphate reductase alpha chain